jgi:hypothetical protein
MKTIVSFCSVAFLLTGCGSAVFDGPCTADYRYGLTVTVIDSVTGSPPASAVLLARSGAYADSVGPAAPQLSYENGPSVLRLSTAGERPGTYELTVRAAGYRDWTLTRVKVTGDECHVRPVAVTARLQR